jgi:serine/threonine protein kinase
VAAQASPTAVGSLLNGTYRLDRVIAEGGMGVVFDAQHVRLPRRFAVKILGKPVDSDTTATTLARFRREAEIASTLAHPHIVEVFDYQVAESGAPYLVMELLEGEDLADRLKKGRVNVIAALRIIAEIAEALDVAHTGGVVHRDLKPANIFLTKRGSRDDHVKVLDFGVSKLIDSATLTQEKAMVGTPLYMSPEQAVGTQELTPESDIFSLGAISYEMLTGRRAFAASSIPSILYQIVHGPTPKVAGKAPGLSTAADEVFARVLAKRKEDRYKRASQFAEDLRVALGREEPGDLAPRTIAFDGDSLEALAAASEPTSDVMGRGAMVTGADETELDSSTKAEEALAPMQPRPSMGAQTAAGKRAPSVVFDPGSAPHRGPARHTDGGVVDSVDPAFERSYTQELRAGSRRRSTLVLGALALAAVGGVVAILQSGAPLHKAAPAAATPPGVAPSATAPPAAPTAGNATAGTTDDDDDAPAAPTANGTANGTATGTAAAPTHFDPEPVERHPDVQFIFHVYPRGAEILVDDKKIPGTRMTVPYGKEAHRVLVRAPGYHTITTSASSTANRTFELRMDRIVVRIKKTPPARPAHDAAPVQDL